MAEEISLSLEETNKIRIQLGLKPIVLADSGTTSGNNHKLPEVRGDQKDIKTQFIDENRISNIRKRLNKASQQIILNLNDESQTNEGWLNKVGSQDKNHTVNISFDDEVEDDDDGNMPVLKLSHKLSEFQNGKDIILTLKDKSINDDKSDDDVLENEALSTFKDQSKNLKLKDMNKERRRKKYTLNVSSKDLEDQDSDKEEQGSVLRINANSTIPTDIEEQGHVIDNNEKVNKIKVEFSDNDSEDDFNGGDFKVAKIKKRKIKDFKSIKKRKKINLPSLIKEVKLIDEDEDEDDLLSLKINRTTDNFKKERPDLVNEAEHDIKKEAMENRRREMEIRKLRNNDKVAATGGGLMIDESASFLTKLNSKLIESDDEKENAIVDDIFTEEDKTHTSTPYNRLESTLPSIPNDKTQSDTSANKEVTFSSGLASTLHFLQDRNVLPTKQEITDNPSNDELLKLKKKIGHRKLEEEREKKYGSDARIQKDQRTVSNIQSEILKEYNPEINLVYRDDNGNELTTKEAYKKLSQRFHGTKSNKRKQAKFDERVQQRNTQKRSAMQSNFFESITNNKEGE